MVKEFLVQEVICIIFLMFLFDSVFLEKAKKQSDDLNDTVITLIEVQESTLASVLSLKD